jgi:hypothetical protein
MHSYKKKTEKQSSEVKRFIQKKNEERQKRLEETQNGWTNKNLGAYFAYFTSGLEFSLDEIRNTQPPPVKKFEPLPLTEPTPKYTAKQLEDKIIELEKVDSSIGVKYFGKDKDKARQKAGFDTDLLTAITLYKREKRQQLSIFNMKNKKTTEIIKRHGERKKMNSGKY